MLVVANKVDDERREADAWGLQRLGLGDPYPVSALHGRGSGDLLDAVVAALPPEADAGDGGDDADDAHLRVAIVGRPNVGKSTLFNRLVGDERSVVHDLPGTTRDSIDTIVETEDGPLRFVDTAGMRRRSRIDEPTEYFSLVRALEAVDRADAALLVIDASQGVTHQDQRLAERVDAAGTAVVIVLNKWDLSTTPRSAASVLDRRRRPARVPRLRADPEGVGHDRAQPAPHPAGAAPGRGGVPPADPDGRAEPAPPGGPGEPPAAARPPHRPRVLYATQGAADPPTFTLFATHALPPTYLRYLERRIREAFELGPTPIKLRVRRRNG